ncbi:MAG: glycosyltransferase family 4 protein, partial [Balneolaceae bacterium]
MTLLNSDENIQADIVVPTPYSIPFTTREKKNKSSLLADDFKNNRLKYLSFPKKKFPATISRSLSRNIQRYFHDKKYDVIHVHWLYPDALCIPALKKMGFKCVLTIHGSDWYQNTDNLVLMDIFEKVLDSTDRVLYSGPLLKRDVERVFPWLSKKSALIYNYVDTNIYTKPTYLEKEKAIEKLGWNPQKINVLTVANIRHEKGIDLLLDAVAETEQFA